MQPGGQPMQDPMNALRAMAHPGGGNQMMNLMPQQGNPQLNASSCKYTGVHAVLKWVSHSNA